MRIVKLTVATAFLLMAGDFYPPGTPGGNSTPDAPAGHGWSAYLVTATFAGLALACLAWAGKGKPGLAEEQL